MAKRDRPLAFGRPDPAQDRLQANAVLVGRPDLDRLARVLRPLLGDGLLQLFLNASRSSGVAEAGWRGRGFCTDQLIAFRASQPRWGKTAASPSSPAIQLAIQAATLRLDHRPPSGGGASSRARNRSRSAGCSTLGTPPLRRRKSPSASGPSACDAKREGLILMLQDCPFYAALWLCPCLVHRSGLRFAGSPAP